MNSKTSFCNKTIIKNDLKRLWWASALSAILMFLIVVIPTLDNVNNYSTWYPERTDAWRIERINNNFADCSYFGMFVGMGTALVLSALLFNYLNKANAVSCIHGLPIKRTTLYFSHLLSGIILLAIPIVVTTPFLLSCINDGIAGFEIFKFIYAYTIYSLCFLTFGTFIGMLTGNSASHIVFTVIAVLLPLFFTFFAAYVGSEHLYGFYQSDVFLEKLLEFVYIFPEKLLSYRAVIYIAAIIVFVVAGLFAYNKRGLENHGEVIAFPKLKGVFKVLVGICAGILGYFYTAGMWDVNEILAMIPFALIGLIIAHMLAQKSFSLRGIIPSLVVTVCIIIAFAGVIRFDLTGFERRVPNVEDIESVSFTNDYVNDTFYINDEINGYHGEFLYLEVYRPVYDTPEEIKLFTDLHQYKVDNRNYVDAVDYFYPYSTPRSFSIVYTLKNGRQMYRSYYLTIDEMRTYMAPIYETETALKYHYPILDETEKTITNVRIEDIRDATGKAYTNYVGTSDEAVRLVEAIKKDRINLTFDEYLEKQQRNGNTKIIIEYTKPGVERYGHKFMSNTITETYHVSNYDVNTLRVLKEIGYYDNEYLMNVEDISYATVNIYGGYKDGMYVDPKVMTSFPEEVTVSSVDIESKLITRQYYDKTGVGGIKFENPEDIKTLYEYAIDKTPVMPITGYSDAVEINIEFVSQSENDFYAFSKSFWATTLTLPAIIKDSFNIVNEPINEKEVAVY